MTDISYSHALPVTAHGTSKTGVTAKLRELATAEITNGDQGDVHYPSMFFPDIDSQRLAALATQLGGAGWYTIRAEEGGCRIWKKIEPRQLKSSTRGRPSNG